MTSLFILQLVCCVITAMLALQLAMASLQVRWKVWRYEISRWLLVASMLFFSVHYLLQMIHGLRAQGIDVGAAFNILFYTPVAFAITLSIINIAARPAVILLKTNCMPWRIAALSVAMRTCLSKENAAVANHSWLAPSDTRRASLDIVPCIIT